jgi:hypothetical protein
MLVETQGRKVLVVPYVGDPFEYDIFVSYAHAESATETPLIREWSQYVAGRLRDRLASALNPTVGDEAKLTMFLDDRVLVSGERLTDLEKRARRSAVLLVLMSPLYPRRPYCLEELEAFFTQADADGRSQRHSVVLRIQPLSREDWPGRLKDERGKPVVFVDLSDSETGLPVGFDDLQAKGLTDSLRKIQIELMGKLKELRKQLEARRAITASAPGPTSEHVIYLHALPADSRAWQQARAQLETRAIVLPEDLPQPPTDDALLQHQRELRLKAYAECDALVLLRASADEAFKFEVMAAFNDRRRLLQERHKSIGWAILDLTGVELPLAAIYKVPQVKATVADWPDQLVRALGLSKPTAQP